MVFVVPELHDNEGGWGPVLPPAQLVDGVPYAPYDKKAFSGRMADWSARAEMYRERRRYDHRGQQVGARVFALPATCVVTAQSCAALP